MSDRPTISDVIRKAAAEAGGVRELARAADVDPSTLSRFIHGQRVRSDQLDRLADALGIEVNQRKRKRKG